MMINKSLPNDEYNTIENYFGIKIKNPFSWLEDKNSEKTQEWNEYQNELTTEFLNTSDKNKIKSEMERLSDYESCFVPIIKDKRFFYFKKSILYCLKDLNAAPEALFDSKSIITNESKSFFNPDSRLLNSTLSNDGNKLIYLLVNHKEDFLQLRIRNLLTNEDYPEIIKTNAPFIKWDKDSNGFYYTSGKNQNHKNTKVYYHKLETEENKDILIYDGGKDDELIPFHVLTEDNHFMILSLFKGAEPINRVYYKRLDKLNEPFTKLLNDADDYYYFIGNSDNIFYFNTISGKIISIDINKPEKANWKEIIPEDNKKILQEAILVNDKLIINVLENVSNKLLIYDLNGIFIKEIEFPEIVSIYIIDKSSSNNELIIYFGNFLNAGEVLLLNLTDFTTKLLSKSSANFDKTKYEIKQVFYPSKDKTQVPMFIIHRKDFNLNGNSPTILQGYGGFGEILKPRFELENILWLESGGVCAIANIRGGGEFGENWHKEAIKDKKQNSFDDFISAAEYLIKNKYTNAEKLVIKGKSNGGLLVASCMVQRPDLFKAVVCEYPMIDMIRYNKLDLKAHFFYSEHGNPELKEDFLYLYSYSPLENIKEGANYPYTFAITSDGDHQVNSAHSKKFIAKLQNNNTDSENRFLVRVHNDRGHAWGITFQQYIEELTEIYTFIFKVLNNFS